MRIRFCCLIAALAFVLPASAQNHEADMKTAFARAQHLKRGINVSHWFSQNAQDYSAHHTDTETTPQTASLPLVLLVVYPTTATDSELIGPYAFLFQGYDDVLAGVLAYQTATIGSLTADGTGVISDGELDANHQSSNPSGNTISSQQFLGTYTLGAASRGYMTITRLNADGTTGGSSTHAITAKAPVSC